LTTVIKQKRPSQATYIQSEAVNFSYCQLDVSGETAMIMVVDISFFKPLRFLIACTSQNRLSTQALIF